MMNISDMSQDYLRSTSTMLVPQEQSPGHAVPPLYSTKHGRDEKKVDDQSSSYQMSTGAHQGQPSPTSANCTIPERSSKRTRSNHYQAPTTVQPSVLTAVGSLVGGMDGRTQSSGSSSAAFVPMRRQLSGGALDKYIGAHDSMDTDMNESTRPRSMSF